MSSKKNNKSIAKLWKDYYTGKVWIEDIRNNSKFFKNKNIDFGTRNTYSKTQRKRIIDIFGSMQNFIEQVPKELDNMVTNYIFFDLNSSQKISEIIADSIRNYFKKYPYQVTTNLDALYTFSKYISIEEIVQDESLCDFVKKCGLKNIVEFNRNNDMILDTKLDYGQCTLFFKIGEYVSTIEEDINITNEQQLLDVFKQIIHQMRNSNKNTIKRFMKENSKKLSKIFPTEFLDYDMLDVLLKDKEEKEKEQIIDNLELGFNGNLEILVEILDKNPFLLTVLKNKNLAFNDYRYEIFSNFYERVGLEKLLELVKYRKFIETSDDIYEFEKLLSQKNEYKLNQFIYEIISNKAKSASVIESSLLSPEDLKKLPESFKNQYPELYIDESAPEDLKDFLNRPKWNRTIDSIKDGWIPFLAKLDLSKYFSFPYAYVYNLDDSSAEQMELFDALKTKFSKEEILDLMSKYLYYMKKSHINIYASNTKEEQYDQIINSIYDNIKKFKMKYVNLPREFKEKYPNIFLAENAPKELQEAFYNRTITAEFILSNPSYKKYLKNIDFDILFSYMPISSSEEITFCNALQQTFDANEALDIMLMYDKYIEQVYEVNKLRNFLYNSEFTQDEFLNELDKVILQNIIDGKMKYDENMSSHFKNNYPTLFLLGADVSQEIKDKFYNREFTLKDFNDNPSLFDIFENTNIACAFSENMSWIIPLFNDIENFKIANYNRMKVISAYSRINDVELRDSLEKYIISNSNKFNIKDIEKIEYVLCNIKDYKKIEKYINNLENPDDLYKSILEILNYSYNWVIESCKNIKNILKIISIYNNINDFSLQEFFRECITNLETDIDEEKIEYISEILLRLSHSNSSEIFRFRFELANQILNSNDSLETLNKIEDVFIKNNIPTVGKIYSCFEILHPDFKGFNFDSSNISPILKKSSTTSKKIIVFSDLIKSAFGSNNMSVNNYLKNIEFGNSLYEDIKNEKIQFDSLSENEQSELIIFRDHLATLYSNTMKGKKENETFKTGEDVLKDILELSKRLSPNGTLDYNLADRVIRMFCGFAGIDTLEQAKEYVEKKIKAADLRNREASNSDMELKQGDFIKGIGDIKYLRNILQNGSVSKEYLGSSAGSDLTPLDTDISIIMSSYGTINEKMNATAAKEYGPIWFVLKNDDRFITTRTGSEELETKRDMSKMEVFYTGALGKSHYGIRTGFASSEINYIVMENYDPRVGLEIAINGFYIPIANKEGKIVFTPKDYDKLREKMNGLSYYGIDEYMVDGSKKINNAEIEDIIQKMKEGISETTTKSNLIWNDIKTAVNNMGLLLKNNIDLSMNSVVLFNTGSTGRYTNVPGDGDFDYTMQVDKDIYSSNEKMELLRKNIIDSLSHGMNISYNIYDGDIRELKTIVTDENGKKHEVEIDITFTEKTDKAEYASDACVSDRLNNISNIEDKEIVMANIIYAKQFLKSIGAYKPARKFPEQGGMGGIGVENWILQNGGTFYSAAKSFIETADKCKSFEEFKTKYSLPNFGINHMAIKKGFYPHDNYIENMNDTGYNKMVEALKEYLKTMKISQVDTETIKR